MSDVWTILQANFREHGDAPVRSAQEPPCGKAHPEGIRSGTVAKRDEKGLAGHLYTGSSI
jgi:hypothetical protein